MRASTIAGIKTAGVLQLEVEAVTLGERCGSGQIEAGAEAGDEACQLLRIGPTVQAVEQGMDVLICTGDRDAYQLVSERVNDD
jgi:hypothetical protein